MKVKKITVFSTKTCPSCVQLKKWLDYKHIPYETVDLTDNPARGDELAKMSGYTTVPQTLIETDSQKQVVVGYNLSQLAPAIA